MFTVRKAISSDLEALPPLFDQYRVFYGQTSDEKKGRNFLKERFDNQESIILIAAKENLFVGFTQLFFSFSSVSLEPTLILNDLYVNPDYRQQGVGALLLKSAQEYCRTNKYKGLALETAIDNPAQRLYERLGWEKDSHCFHYFWLAQ